MITQYSDEAPEYMAAVKKLWGWTHTIEARWKQTEQELSDFVLARMAFAAQDELQYVRKEMRTLFVGLIDFDE